MHFTHAILPIIRFEIYVIVNQISNTISTSRVAVCPQQSIQSTVHNYIWRYEQFSGEAEE